MTELSQGEKFNWHGFKRKVTMTALCQDLICSVPCRRSGNHSVPFMDPRELTGKVLVCSFGFRCLIHPFSRAGLVQALLTQKHAAQRFSSDDKLLWGCCFDLLQTITVHK